jgi:allantoinase
VIIRSSRVVLPDGIRPAALDIAGAVIARIDTKTALLSRPDDVLDFGDLVVAPGLVDTHVHVNEPGRTEWEGFDTATRAAAAGGVTTIVDMPLNSVPPTTTVAALEQKRRAAEGRCHVDVAFWGGVVPGNARDLEPLARAGVRGFKCFLVPSGVDEFPAVGEADLREAMPIVARCGLPLLVHAESPACITEPARGAGPGGSAGVTCAAYVASRPPAAEVEAIRLMVRLVEAFGTRVHIVHVASAGAAHEVAVAKDRGLPVSGETCPHYLTFSSGDIEDDATVYKCAPPIREARHRDALWEALRDGVLDLVATDHSPAPPALKCGDFAQAWGGIASLELSLAAVWTAGRAWPAGGAAGEGQVTPRAIARWMSEAPARLAGLGARKGRLAPGCDADICVWDPDARVRVDPGRLQQRHKLTPYAGRTLAGRVAATFVRGRQVWDGRSIAVGHGSML